MIIFDDLATVLELVSLEKSENLKTRSTSVAGADESRQTYN